jgi:hypothetical protein
MVFKWKRGLYALGHAASSWRCRSQASAIASLAAEPAAPPPSSVRITRATSTPVLFRTLHPYLHILYKAELHKFPIMGPRLMSAVSCQSNVRIASGRWHRSAAARSRCAPAIHS